MKGRANYVCRQKVYDAEREPLLSGIEEVRDFRLIREWEQETETGDRAELVELSESSTAWHKLDARRDLCSGQKCKQFDRCFITAMHRRAVESDIIIVNHHLFFADLAVRDDAYGGILPDYSAVIFDEAHEIEDIAGQYFGISVSNLQIQELVEGLRGRGSPETVLHCRTGPLADLSGRPVGAVLLLVSRRRAAGLSRSSRVPGDQWRFLSRSAGRDSIF